MSWHDDIGDAGDVLDGSRGLLEVNRVEVPLAVCEEVARHDRVTRDDNNLSVTAEKQTMVLLRVTGRVDHLDALEQAMSSGLDWLRVMGLAVYHLRHRRRGEPLRVAERFQPPVVVAVMMCDEDSVNGF